MQYYEAPFGDRKEMDLLRRAIKERWPIPDGKRAAWIERAAQVIETADADPKAVLAGLRAMLEADKLNMEQEKRDLGIADKLEVTGKDGEPLIQFYLPQNNRDENPSANGAAGTVPQ